MPRKGENIHKRKDGRWEGRYIKKHDISGKAIYGSVYAKTYLDVKRKLIEMNKLALDNALPSKQQTVAFREVLYLTMLCFVLIAEQKQITSRILELHILNLKNHLRKFGTL